MLARPRRYRIENPSPRADERGTAGPDLVVTDGRIAAPSPRQRTAGTTDEQWAALQRLATDLHEMRDAIATTKSEISDLQTSPSGATGMHRAACELDAVSSAAERATTTILTAVEDIELSANLIQTATDKAGRADATATILDRVLVLYETCNFQDISGQRIRKVVTTLKFVEERLDRVIAAWGDHLDRARSSGEASGASLLGGPRLPGDLGHVSQSDVDALFP